MTTIVARAINGMRLTADAATIYKFVSALYDSNRFNFERLAQWLHSHVEHDVRK